MQREDYLITEVREADAGYMVSTKQGIGFHLDKQYGVRPNKGDVVALYIEGASYIRGVEINGAEVYFKTDEQIEAEKQQYRAEAEKNQNKEFEQSKDKMDADYKALPEVFRKRIDRFRNNNKNFRVKFEKYELFCCKEAIAIADHCGSGEGVKSFSDLPYEQQVEVISDDHSGNTFGMACRLAYWYLEKPENIKKEHGALCPMIGCYEYGCKVPDAPTQEKQEATPTKPQKEEQPQKEDDEPLTEEEMKEMTEYVKEMRKKQQEELIKKSKNTQSDSKKKKASSKKSGKKTTRKTTKKTAKGSTSKRGKK